jgi:hypothetical protein
MTITNAPSGAPTSTTLKTVEDWREPEPISVDEMAAQANSRLIFVNRKIETLVAQRTEINAEISELRVEAATLTSLGKQLAKRVAPVDSTD